GFRERITRPIDGTSRVWIELSGFVQASRNSIVISPNCHGVEALDSFNCFNGIRTISDKVSTAKNGIVTSLFCTLETSFKGLYVGMDVTEDEIAHGVS